MEAVLGLGPGAGGDRVEGGPAAALLIARPLALCACVPGGVWGWGLFEIRFRIRVTPFACDKEGEET